MKKTSQRKLSQRLSEEQYLALKKHIPDQLRQRVFNTLINGLIALYESSEGDYVNAFILSGKLPVSIILNKGREENEGT